MISNNQIRSIGNGFLIVALLLLPIIFLSEYGDLVVPNYLKKCFFYLVSIGLIIKAFGYKKR